MTAQEFNRKQTDNQIALLRGPEPTNQDEKDIWNLKYLRCSIRCGSFNFRSGMIATLDRAIKELENKKGETNESNLPGDSELSTMH